MTTTAKGVPHPVDSDAFDVVEWFDQLAAWLDARPGTSTHTTAERDLLVGADIWAGRIIYNSTTDRLEINRTGVAGAANWGPLAIADISGVTAFIRTLLDDTDAAAARATLGAQAADATLTALAALTVAANQLVYANGSESFATTPLSAFIRTLLDDADAATARATLGAQASDTDLTAIAALTSAANKLLYATGAGTWALADLTAFARTILDDADATAVRATLGISQTTLDARYLNQPGALLGSKSHSPTVDTTYTTSSGTLVDVDATNAAVTFTAPASGQVLVRINAVTGYSSGSGVPRLWGVREGSTLIAQAQVESSSFANDSRREAVFLITGLSAGSHTFKFAHGAAAGGVSTIHAGTVSGTVYYGAIVMEVYAA